MEKNECTRCRVVITGDSVGGFCSLECKDFQAILDKTKRLAIFDGGHSRTGTVELVYGKIYYSCDRCCICKSSDNYPLLAIDNSEDEYCPGLLCLTCMQKIIDDNIDK